MLCQKVRNLSNLSCKNCTAPFNPSGRNCVNCYFRTFSQVEKAVNQQTSKFQSRKNVSLSSEYLIHFQKLSNNTECRKSISRNWTIACSQSLLSKNYSVLSWSIRQVFYAWGYAQRPKESPLGRRPSPCHLWKWVLSPLHHQIWGWNWWIHCISCMTSWLFNDIMNFGKILYEGCLKMSLWLRKKLMIQHNGAAAYYLKDAQE